MVMKSISISSDKLLMTNFRNLSTERRITSEDFQIYQRSLENALAREYVDNKFAEKYNRAFQKALDYDVKTLSSLVREEIPEIEKWFEKEDKLISKIKRKDTISYKKMRKLVKELIQDKEREKWSESRRKELRLSILEALKAVRTLIDYDLINSLLRLLVNKHTVPKKSKKQKIEILAFALRHSLPEYMTSNPDYIKEGTLLPLSFFIYTEKGRKDLIRLLIQIMPCFLFKEIFFINAQNIFYSFPSVFFETEDEKFKASDSLKEEEFSSFVQIVEKNKNYETVINYMHEGPSFFDGQNFSFFAFERDSIKEKEDKEKR